MSNSITPRTDCNRDALPEFWTGQPTDQSWWAIPNWNESLAGMQECCTPNEVQVGGDGDMEGCVLWCVIPDSFLKDKDGKVHENKNGVLSDMGNCVKNRGNVSTGYITGGKVRDSSAAVSARTTTLFGVGVWALLTVGMVMA
ncbi:hypothetical protein B0T20DRAFT_111417 [Sordaria brevicollis]|uniref:Uncharacterized protein n=1 Tax=Sordaria brevicollis TaxID=83679 RepID=A0AAE0NRG9_SORBR|nr:hypothetical protein B0T20DRAFT_111417 [Sordaria brevicollis]